MPMDMWNAPSDRDYSQLVHGSFDESDEEPEELPEVTTRPDGECPITSLPPCCYVPTADDDLPF